MQHALSVHDTHLSGQIAYSRHSVVQIFCTHFTFLHCPRRTASIISHYTRISSTYSLGGLALKLPRIPTSYYRQFRTAIGWLFFFFGAGLLGSTSAG